MFSDHNLSSKFSTVDHRLSSVEPKLSSVKPKLPSVVLKLPSTQPNLPPVEPKLSSVEPKLSSVELKLSSVEPKLSSVEPKLEGRGTLERTLPMNQATAGAEREQSAVGAGGGCSLVMRRADIGRGDGSRRNDAVEVGGVASVRGSGAAASEGLEGSCATSCGSSEGAVCGRPLMTKRLGSSARKNAAKQAAKLVNAAPELAEEASKPTVNSHVARGSANGRKNKWAARQAAGPEEH